MLLTSIYLFAFMYAVCLHISGSHDHHNHWKLLWNGPALLSPSLICCQVNLDTTSHLCKENLTGNSQSSEASSEITTACCWIVVTSCSVDPDLALPYLTLESLHLITPSFMLIDPDREVVLLYMQVVDHLSISTLSYGDSSADEEALWLSISSLKSPLSNFAFGCLYCPPRAPSSISCFILQSMLPLSQTCCCLWWQILSIQTILILYTLQFLFGFIFTDLKSSVKVYTHENYIRVLCNGKTWPSANIKRENR